MEILLPDNTNFNLNQPTSKLIDSKMCVFDYSDKNDIDFFMKKITTFISYRYPTAEILVGGKYRVELPLNWRVMITDKHDFLCQLVGIEELLHFPNDPLISHQFSHIPSYIPYNSLPHPPGTTLQIEPPVLNPNNAL